MHALGHAAMALAAGACASALLGSAAVLGRGSTTLEWLGVDKADAFSLSLVGLAAVLVKAFGGVCATYSQARLAFSIGGDLRLRVLDGWLACHRLHQPRQDDHGAAGDGANSLTVGAQARGVAALTSRVREVEAGMQIGVLGGARAMAQLLPLLAVLIWISPRLACAAALVFVPFAIALSRVRRGWKRANARAARQSDALLEASDEAVRHADLWTTYGAEAKVRAHVGALGRAIAVHSARVEASAAALSGANEVLGALALACALGAGRAGWLGADASGAVLLPFAVSFFLAYRPLRDLTDARLAFVRAQVAMEALAGVLDAAPAVHSEGASARPVWELARLSLEDVKVARGSLSPLSFCAEPGQIVAISGATGVGKTTLLRTLLGLERPLGGDIRYDGIALRDGATGPLQRPFAWVPQEAPLLGDTLDANVQLGSDDADSRAVLASIGAEHLVAAVGSARLGAGGRVVSGGERQWIALARAVATRLPVLLLDEPTSGLDGAAQARVLDAIVRLRGERTVVMVTHRPEPLAIADAVIHLA